MTRIENIFILDKKNTTLFLLFFLITLSSYNINIGFSLKPYMIFLFVFFLRSFPSFTFHRLYIYEILLFLFYFVYGYSGIFSRYPEASLRILLGVILILICYFIMRYMLIQYSAANISYTIMRVGILFNLISLALYIIGIQKLHFLFTDHHVLSYGVLIDRAYPRLVGILDDPNLYVFYNTIFFTFFLCNTSSSLGRFGLSLATLTNILTFSRGGLLAVILITVLYLILHCSLKKIISTFGFIVLLCSMGYIITYLIHIDVVQILNERIYDFQEDGGSGRFTLWQRSLQYFIENPILGIGAFNFSEYNTFHYQEKLYVHNTFLEVLTETGASGFFFYLLFLLTTLKETLKRDMLRKYPYLFLIFIGFLLQMLSLSLIINEAFFLYLALLTSCIRLTAQEEHDAQCEKTINLHYYTRL